VAQPHSIGGEEADRQHPAACARRNFAQDLPARRGAGPAPAARRILRTAAAGTPVPQARQLALDPAVAHAGFCPASRKISRRTSARVEGLPGRRRGYVHLLATSSRCQRTTVAGL
jgi:hypothetical protein